MESNFRPMLRVMAPTRNSEFKYRCEACKRETRLAAFEVMGNGIKPQPCCGRVPTLFGIAQIKTQEGK